jgi:hypothetical protein
VSAGRHDLDLTEQVPSGLLTQYRNLATIVKHTRAEIKRYAGSNAAHVQIMVTETNSSLESDSVPAALFAVDTYLTWVRNGVDNIDWWDLHNGPGSPSTRLPDGSTDYGDGGILSSGGCDGAVCEPAANTPFPATACRRFPDSPRAGAKMIGVTSSNAAVTAYAVKTSSGMNLMLVNHSPHSSKPVSIGYTGFKPTSVTSALQFSDAHPKLRALSRANAHSLTLPAYSITILKLSGSASRTAHLTAWMFTSRRDYLASGVSGGLVSRFRRMESGRRMLSRRRSGRASCAMRRC